eukprot:7380784-Prymnesium_polylepis.4
MRRRGRAWYYIDERLQGLQPIIGLLVGHAQCKDPRDPPNVTEVDSEHGVAMPHYGGDGQ